MGWVPVVPWLLAPSVTSLEGLLSLFSTLPKARLGYLQWINAFLRWAWNPSNTVYRKPSHTDQYLQWDSHHLLSANFSVIHTLTHRAQTVCSNPDLLCKEKAHLRKVLTQCKYPKWALDKVEKRLNKPSREVTDGANNQGTTGTQPTNNEVKTKGHIVIPCTQDLCESIKKICGRYGIQTHFKGSNTIRNLLVSPKDKDLMVSKSGAYTGSNVVTFHVMMNI